MRRISYIAVFAVAAVTLGVTAHAQTSNAPEFSSAVLDGTTGQLTISFDKNIDLAELDFTKLHIRDQGSSTGGVPLELYDDTVTADVSYPDSPSDSFDRGFDDPYGIAINGTDHIFIVDTFTPRVQILHPYPDTTVIKDLVTGSDSDDQFMNPSSVAINSTGYIFVANTGNNRVQIFDPNGTQVDAINRAGSDALVSPNGVAIDSNDRIIVSGNRDVYIFDPNGMHVDTIGDGTQDGVLNAPEDVATDSNDRIIVPQNEGDRIGIFTSDGRHVQDIEPNGVNRLYGVTIDDNDRIIAADQQADRIYIFSPDGLEVDRIGLDAGASDAALDSAGRLYVTGDFDRVEVFNPISADIRLMLDDDALDTIGNMANPVLDIGAGAVRTVGGDTIAASIDNAVIVPDKTPPKFQLAKLYNTTGEFSIYLDEQVNPFSTDPTELHIRDRSQSEGGITLSTNPIILDTYSFDSDIATNATHGTDKPSSIAVASDGDIIIADSANHCVRILHTDGTETIVGKDDTCGTDKKGNGDEEFEWPRGVAVNSTDHIFVADYDNDRVVILDQDGDYVGQYGTTDSNAGSDSNDLPGHFRRTGGVAVDGNDRVIVADVKYNRIQIFDPHTYDRPTIEIGARTDDAANVPNEGSGDAEFKEPRGMAVNSTNHIFIADLHNHRIQILNPNGTYAGEISKGARGNDNKGNGTGEFDGPHGVAIDNTDRIIVADTGNDRIQIFSPDGTYVAQFNSDGTDDGKFNRPRGVAIDGLDILVADTNNDRIQRFTPDIDGSTHIMDDITPHLYKSAGSYGTANGMFNQTSDIVIHDGRTYVVDSANHRVQIFGPGGDHIRSIGNTTSDGEPVIGTGNGHFKWPRGIVVDSENRILVSDADNDRIQIFNPDGGFIGNITAPDLDGPHGIDANDGRIFVAARNTNTIQIFNSDGDHTGTINGSSADGFRSPEDVAVGAGLIAVADTKKDRVVIFDSADFSHVRTFDKQFNEPRGITIDDTGRIWVSDTKNHNVQVFDSDGTGIYTFGSEGTGTMQLDEPRGIIISEAGHAWVADTGNHRIQTFAFSSDGLAFNLTSRALSMVNGMNTPELDIDQFAIHDTAGNPIERSHDNKIFTDTTAPVIGLVSIMPDSGTVGYGGTIAITLSASKSGDPISGLFIHPDLTINNMPIKRDTLFYDGNYTITYTVSESDDNVRSNEAIPANIILYDMARNPSNTITTLQVDDALEINAQKAAVTLEESSFSQDGSTISLRFNKPVGIDDILSLQITDGLSSVRLSDDGVAFSPEGDEYVQIQEISSGSGTSAIRDFNQPSDIAIGPNGTVLVADAADFHIEVFGPGGVPLREFGEADSSKYDDMQWPRSVAVSSNGRIFVTDTVQHRMLAFTQDGSSLVRGIGANNTIGLPYKGSGNYGFNGTEGVAVNGSSVFVADTNNNRIQVFNHNLDYMRTLDLTGDLEPNMPTGIEVGPNGTIYISDSGNNRILAVSPDGVGTVLVNTDGRLNDPHALAVYGDMLFVADRNSNLTRMYDRTDGAYLGAIDDGFNKPRGVAVNSTGHVFVADTANDRVVVFGLAPTGFSFALSGETLAAVQRMDSPYIDITVGNIMSHDGIHLAMPYRVQPYVPVPDDSDDTDARVTVEVAVPETPDRSTLLRPSSGGGSSIIISDPPIVQNPDKATSVLHRVYWETSNDMITLYVVTSTDGSEPDVSLMTPDSGTITAKISDSQPYPDRILYEAEILASNSFAQVYVDGVSKHILLDAPDGNVSVTLYDGPDMTTSPVEPATDEPAMTETKPDPVIEPETPVEPEPVEPAMKDDIEDVDESIQDDVVDPEPPISNDQTTDGGGINGCLIATAAYGTELAPQVQLLREIRDGSLLQTDSGTAFMGAFNNIYYAFSPTIADLQRENPVIREATKLLLTPMLYTLNIMSMADDEASVLGLGLSVIALNVGMYVAAPAFAGYTIYKHRKNV